MKIKTAISLILSIIFIDKIKYDFSDISSIQLFLIILNEAFIAFLIGLSINIIFYSYKIFGELLSFSAGLSMAQMFDPSTGAQEQVMNKLFYVLIIYIFFYSGFYELLIMGINNLFIYFPVGVNIFTATNFYDFIITKFAYVLLTMYIMALPFFLMTTLTDIYFGYSTRNSPSFNIFAIAFQMKFAMLLFFLMIMTPKIITNFTNILEEMGKGF